MAIENPNAFLAGIQFNGSTDDVLSARGFDVATFTHLSPGVYSVELTNPQDHEKAIQSVTAVKAGGAPLIAFALIGSDNKTVGITCHDNAGTPTDAPLVFVGVWQLEAS